MTAEIGDRVMLREDMVTGAGRFPKFDRWWVVIKRGDNCAKVEDQHGNVLWLLQNHITTEALVEDGTDPKLRELLDEAWVTRALAAGGR